MDFLSIAEENFLISWAGAISIGLLHGAILGRGIRNRFPSLKRHARAVSLILLILFSINAIANVIKFAIPEKIEVSDLTFPSTPEEMLSIVVGILGLDAGIWAVVVTFISITLILFFRFTNLPSIARYFIFALSVIVVVVALVSRFTDYVPTVFQITMYASYQIGITIGLFLVTRRRQTDVLSEIR